MKLSSRHRMRNSSPGGLRPSTLPLGHGGSPQYWLSHVDGEETFFVSFKPPRPGTEARTLAWKAAVLTTTLGPPPFRHCISILHKFSILHFYFQLTLLGNEKRCRRCSLQYNRVIGGSLLHDILEIWYKREKFYYLFTYSSITRRRTNWCYFKVGPSSATLA